MWLLIVSAVSLINQAWLRISALPHTSRCVMIVPHLSPFSVTFLTRVTMSVTQRDSHVTTRLKTWHSGCLWRKCSVKTSRQHYRHQQVLSWAVRTCGNIYLFPPGSAGCGGDADTRSFTNYPGPESRPHWLLTFHPDQSEVRTLGVWPMRGQGSE